MGLHITDIAGRRPCKQSSAQIYRKAAGDGQKGDRRQKAAASILIVEDEPLIAMDLEMIVTGLGHRVQAVARTKEEAVEAAKQSRPEVVLADVNLADGSSGMDAVQEIIRDGNIPVIFITAYPEQVTQGHRPPDAYLVAKPYTDEIVRSAIEHALSHA
jgi:CheY-like chemotaxis protein